MNMKNKNKNKYNRTINNINTSITNNINNINITLITSSQEEVNIYLYHLQVSGTLKHAEHSLERREPATAILLLLL